jgi:putative zinc finger/helix-turn-helix YgiT family protein
MKPANQSIGREPLDVQPMPECPDCDATDSRLEYLEQSFRYGPGDGAVELRCEVPVYTCNRCGYEWTGHEAEDARQVAVCCYLGRLSPDEVRSIREIYRLSQAEFSRITGFGEASLSRWETGAQVQNSSSDRLLRLILADERNLDRLKQVEAAKDPGWAAHFRVLTLTPELQRRKLSFQLLRAS